MSESTPDTWESGWRVCAMCGAPYSGGVCTNPGCEASGNVPPEVVERRKREAEEERGRERVRRIRDRIGRR